MGSFASKASRLAGPAATKRKYPQRDPSPAAPPQSARATPTSSSFSSPAPGPTVHPNLQASASKTEAINLDAADPTFAQSLRTLGPVTPSSTLSNSSTFHHHQQQQQQPSSPSSSPDQNQRPSSSSHLQFPSHAANPALQILAARSRLAAEAEREFARAGRAPPGSDGARRRFVDVSTLRRALVLRDQHGVPGEEIERRLGLERGVVRMLGRTGVVGVVASSD